MKQFLILFILFLFSSVTIAQEGIRYINFDQPIVQNAVPSRDGNNIYHFYFEFNWVNEISSYSDELKPKIEELQIYESGTENIIKSSKAPFNQDNQIEFRVKKSDIDRFNQIEYAVKWHINDASGENMLTKFTKRRTMNVNFKTDPKLIVQISDERIYYLDDINKPRIKIKTNHNGASVDELTLRLRNDPESAVVARINKTVTQLNNNKYSELVFDSTEGEAEIQEGKTYYLFGNVSTPNLNARIFENNTYQIYKREQYYIKPLDDGTKTIKVKGNLDKQIVLDATGKVSEVKATLKLGDGGKKEYSLDDLDNNRWELKIPGNTNIQYGTYVLEITGNGSNGQPMKPTSFSYVKTPIKRKIIQMEIKDGIYKVNAEFTETPTNNVYLVIDDFDVMMNKDAADSKKYSVSFAFDDNTLQSISNKIKASAKNTKKVLLTTKIDDINDESYLATNAVIIDKNKLADMKKKSEVKKYLEDIGFQENVDKLAKSIMTELKKEDNDQDWGANVWSSLVEWAPKAIPLVLMLL
ncbi:hypothetical protein LCM02_12410 [Lutimonas saemankumensis]|uniref:hypothetical protein n=1 Tax=Lutimonas saemankumensis TaxID=483016 RepID=UPI001CD652C6|nr:hypothetical protein [Lutimonas saemankumensis]MCA0933257.1 hypothetical protein [Lutimonas saemankumensis]